MGRRQPGKPRHRQPHAFASPLAGEAEAAGSLLVGVTRKQATPAVRIAQHARRPGLRAYGKIRILNAPRGLSRFEGCRGLLSAPYVSQFSWAWGAVEQNNATFELSSAL